jgi:pimeloyl-ACP methyl ester carboxylesterase
MAFADHQGVRIYYEVEGQGPPILLAHGLTGDTTFWRNYGYVEPLKGEYRLILYEAMEGATSRTSPLPTTSG